MDSGEEVIEYMVGPRGKIEVGMNGVAGLVREVYGRPNPDAAVNENDDGPTAAERAQMEDFERRLRRSLGITERVRERNGGGDEDGANGDDADEGRRRRTRHSRRHDDDEEEEEYDE